VAFRRSLLEKTAEWFDPRLNLTEDYDLFLRLLSLTDGYYSPLSAGDYRVHANNLSSVLRTKWSDEMSLVYEKLKALVPEFETRYATETAVLRAKIAYLYARNRIADGDGAGARAYLKPFRFQSASYFLLYLIGFAPTGLWTSGYRLYRRLRYGLSDSPA